MFAKEPIPDIHEIPEKHVFISLILQLRKLNMREQATSPNLVSGKVLALNPSTCSPQERVYSPFSPISAAYSESHNKVEIKKILSMGK